MRIALFIAAFSLLVACDTEPTPTGPPQQIPVTNPVDPGGPPKTIELVTTEFCSVELIWNFTDKNVTFVNKTDQTAWVTVTLVKDNTQVVDNIVLPQDEETKDAPLVAKGLEVDVLVEFLDPNWSLDQWPDCGKERYLLGV